MNISEFVRAEEEEFERLGAYCTLEAKREAAAARMEVAVERQQRINMPSSTEGLDVQFNAPEKPKYQSDMSAQPCGCDKGANWYCDQHRPFTLASGEKREYANPQAGFAGLPEKDQPSNLPTATYKPAMSIAHWEKDRPLLPEPNVKNVRTKPMTGIGGAPTRATTLPVDAKGRKEHPLASGVLDYFPDALVALSHVSWRGNEQHNLGTALHWDRSKSADEADTAMRHFVERGTMDTDGIRHTAKFAWRALAMLQKEIEQEKV